MTDEQAQVMRILAYIISEQRAGNQFSDDLLWRTLRHAEEILLKEGRRHRMYAKDAGPDAEPDRIVAYDCDPIAEYRMDATDFEEQ